MLLPWRGAENGDSPPRKTGLRQQPGTSPTLTRSVCELDPPPALFSPPTEWFRCRPCCPEGAPQNSPGQRPGENRLAAHSLPCKGRNNLSSSKRCVRQTGFYRNPNSAVLPRLLRPFRAGLSTSALSPGRCPGLICRGPFGAQSKRRPTTPKSVSEGFGHSAGQASRLPDGGPGPPTGTLADASGWCDEPAGVVVNGQRGER